MARGIEGEIDRLYQLPLDEFTAARNALAKEAGPGAGRIRQLTKPPLAAWAVNQLHWRQPIVYDALIESARSLRTTHKAVLSGRKGDIRSADAAHDKAVEHAVKAALAIVAAAGHPATDATRQAVLQTLRALPANDPPGRLAKTLQPGGFEMLAGVKVSGARGQASRLLQGSGTRKQEPAGRSAAQSRAEEARRAKEEKLAAKRAREAKAAAERALREAEHAARRGEFEVARAERDADRARKRLAETQSELDAARKRVAAAKQELERLH